MNGSDDKELFETAKTVNIVLNFDNGHEKVLDPGIWDVVKREDLKELLIGYEDYAHAYPVDEKQIEFHKRIKEEYNE